MARRLSGGAVECDAVIVAGFGFRAAARVASLQDAYDQAAADRPATHLATLEDKAASQALRSFARSCGLPIVSVPQAELADIDTPTQSGPSRQARHTGSVAEAAALAVAGAGARLLGTRAVSDDRMATCALAIAGDGLTKGEET